MILIQTAKMAMPLKKSGRLVRVGELSTRESRKLTSLR